MYKPDAVLDPYFGEDPRVNEVIFRHSREDLARHFRFLDEFGANNILNAPPVFAEAFGLTTEDAKIIWQRWLETNRDGRSVENRVLCAEGWRSHDGMRDPREA